MYSGILLFAWALLSVYATLTNDVGLGLQALALMIFACRLRSEGK